MSQHPQRKTYEVEYWTCWNSEHRHRTQALAETCLTREPGEIHDADWRLMRRTNELNALKWAINGVTQKEISKRIGVNQSRVGVLIFAAKCRIKNRFTDLTEKDLKEDIHTLRRRSDLWLPKIESQLNFIQQLHKEGNL